MIYTIDLSKTKKKNIYSLGENFYGKSPVGGELGFTNYYMQKNGKPYYGVCGEFHFTRCDVSYWRDELLKMKEAKINIVSTYIFWNHHEEKEGDFCFSGRRDLRRFIKLCQEIGLYVIVRIGPFDHGEVRNGGLPDWLYGKPFEVRETNEGFLYYVKRLFEQLALQMKGLYFKDGGPIIAAQIDNEYEHSAAPWEVTTGVANEWVSLGHEGNNYMYAIQKLAIEAGIVVPFYTCTAWGGAATPKEMLPLWGGYAYRPWLFYSYSGEHPATQEYHYSDFHNNDIPAWEDFSPYYKPEEKPYACCEMGGGMMCSYYYRFQLPYKSVDAMANIKMASGCNFLGYYVFKGGTNPKGEKTEFLNESQVPKLNYDYQAAIGEFGQLRESYKRLKALHYFIESFGEEFCQTTTILPEGAMDILPEDVEQLRYAVRIKDNRGFLFLNNFQDHVRTKEKKDETVVLKLQEEVIRIEPISLAPEENCILPFNMDLDGICLKYALAQPITTWKEKGEATYLFMIPEGMEEKLVFEEGVNIECSSHLYGNCYSITKEEKKCKIYTVSREIMNNLYQIEQDDIKILLITNGALLNDKNDIRLETEEAETTISIFPANVLQKSQEITRLESQDTMWGLYKITALEKEVELKIAQVGPTRYTITIPEDIMAGSKDVILQIEYEGDIGQAFINGEMIHDHFYNGGMWEIGLKTYAEALKYYPLTIYITPLKKGVKVNVESAMAARMEEVEEIKGRLISVNAKPIYEAHLSLKQFE
ncbi:beta-galactosidase [Sporanaerobium hydrogeniformans]|uniref:Beta-galactosidase n=1 Tax=Sporanaerobium hydrogeniformans TaxID=3072179 RepID=A0AC61DGJ1_9FIRM|nr:beta-galactosidase [Sporanaerobium hydrogeniformans]PHV71978.1 beta-galactosidase [Sporanaerobium hydrogeniformans]